MDLKKRLGPRHARSMFGSPEPRYRHSESPRKRDLQKKTMFKRLEKGVFHSLGDKGKSISAYSNDSRRRSYHSSRRDTKSCYRSSRSRETEFASEKRHNKRPSTLTRNTRVWFDDLLNESIDSYDDLKEAFLKNYLQQKKCMKDPVKIHNIKQRDGESIEEFMRRGEMAASNHERKKLFPSWKQQEAGHKPNFKKGGFRNQQRPERKQDRFTLLTKIPKEIMALDKGKFKPPPPMTTPRVAKQSITQNFSSKLVISFPPLGEDDGMEGPMIIEAEMGGHFVHRMYVDEGSSSEILYEHCFNRFRPEVRSQMIPAATPLVGFSREIIWPLGQILLLVKIGDEEHSTSAWINFMILRSPSPYNGIIGRPRKELCGLLRRNLDIFAWKPVDMTGVSLHIEEHRLNIREGCLPVRQKKGQAPE
nr:reverse transcriptase domain-containing protein [Tanacetum cinerariifolium]